METQSSNPVSAESKQQAAESPHHDNPPLPELRLVLLGRKGTGKSSSGNTILGATGIFESGKPTEECVKRRADVASYRVTVVDTPGWEWYYSGNGTPAWVTRETMRSVTVCPPGPHALLLVIRSFASVTEDYYKQVEEHLALLGKTPWTHTMLLFTRGEELGSGPIEQRLQNAGKSFQKLLKKCGNRFHVFENKRCGKDATQVKELIRKMEEMVKESGGRHYECDPLLLEIEVEGKRRARERRKKQRIMEAQAHKGIIKAVLTSDISPSEDLDEMSLFSRGSRRLPEVRMILLGERETGKSSAGNTILRGSEFFQTGQATEECSRQQAEISGRLVTVVDVPGWEGGPEGITPDRVKREICSSVALCPPGPHALLLTLRVDALVRAPAVREHLELLGDGVWRHTILLFTRGDQLREGVTIEQHIQGGGKDLHWLLEKCGNRYHVISSAVMQGDSLKAAVTSLLEKVEKIVAGNRCEAFSPIVQEIQEFGRQKNERFSVKLKEVNDKLQRQELELKRMREREVKSIRRIFDWRRDKGKSPAKTSREREEGTDKTEDDRKSIMGELEERMAWLTEDREREIQELSLENNRAIVALNQVNREKEEVTMRLDEKERENEELKEKVDELQVNVFELKRSNMLKEQEREEREEERARRHEDAENELKGQLDHKQMEGEELRKRVEEMQMMMTESKLKYEGDILNEKQELEKSRAEKNKLEKRLGEKQEEMEEIKTKSENKLREQEERLREINERRETEKNKLCELTELMTKEMEELQIAYRQQVESSEAARQMHDSTIILYNELVDKLVEKDAELSSIQQRQHVQELVRNEIESKLQKQDVEMTALVKKGMEKEQDIETLKQTIEANQRTIENVKNESNTKMNDYTSRIKYLENEYKEMEEFLKRENVILKEEIEVMKKLNQGSIRKIKDDTRKNLEVKENIINHLRQQNEESGSLIKDLNVQLKEVQINVESLQNQNASLTQEFDGLQITCEDYKRDLQIQIIKNESKEKEMKDMLNQLEEMGKIKDVLNQENIQKKEDEICLLKQRNQTQQVELEVMNETAKELEKKTDEMRKYYEERLSERIAEMDVKAAERERRLHSKELELCDREQILSKNMQELERGKKDLKKRNDEMNCRQQELSDGKQHLDRREDEVSNKENELKLQYQNNQSLQESLEEREREITEREKTLESKYSEHSDLSEKWDLERENIKKQLEEKEIEVKRREQELRDEKQHLDKREDEVKVKETEVEHQCQNNQSFQESLKKREKELTEKENIFKCKYNEHKGLCEKWDLERENVTKQLEEKENRFRKTEEDFTRKEMDLQGQIKEVERQKENLDIRDKEFSRREQRFLESEQLIEVKIQELTKGMQEMEENKQDFEKWHGELKTKECSLMQRSVDIQKKEQELLQTEHDLQIKTQNLLQTKTENEAHEQELLNKQESQALECDQLRNELETIRDTLAKREQELRNTEDILNKREQEFKDREKEFEMKEEQITKKYEEYEATEKILESNQRVQKELSERQEKEIENIRQQLKEKEKEFIARNDEILAKQINLQRQMKDFATISENLDDRENEIKKVEQELINSEQLCKLKAQELSKGAEELEKRRAQNEKWQAELTNTEHDLLQWSNKLHKKEEELVQTENNLQLQKCQELLSKNVEVESVQQQLLSNRQNQMPEKWESQLEDFRQRLALREQELNKKEDEFQKREQNIRSAEIYLDKREIIVQKREEEVQINKEQNDVLLNDLKKKQEIIEEIKGSSEIKQNELGEQEKELGIREQNITNKEQDLNNRYQELDLKEHNMEKHALDLKSREQAVKKTEQELNDLEITLKTKKSSLENHTAELENQRSEIDIEKQMLTMKSEQLEKWGKYLYNMELKMINSNPSPDFQPWNHMTAFNRAQAKNSESMYQEVGIDGRTFDRENGNSNAAEDDESVERASSSENTSCEVADEELRCIINGKGALEVMMQEYRNGSNKKEVVTLIKEDGVEEFFEPAASDDHVPQGLFYQHTELKLMLIGETWSSHQSATKNLLGQDAEVSNPWRGNISGRPLLVVEPHGIKWRCSRNTNITFQRDLMHSVSLCTPGPHAFILLLPAYLAFTGQYRRAVESTMAMLGEAAWRHTVVLFTWAEALGESGQQHIMRNGDLEWLIQKCSGRYHVLDNRHRKAHVVELLEVVYEMVAANHGRYYQAH